VETSGYDLKPIADVSVDLVYCTAVFMHLEQWDRYNYVEEAFRVLATGGNFDVDNVDLCSRKGGDFSEAPAIRPETRPAHITECSTPQELEEYLRRAGFEDIQTFEATELVSVWAGDQRRLIVKR